MKNIFFLISFSATIYQTNSMFFEKSYPFDLLETETCNTQAKFVQIKLSKNEYKKHIRTKNRLFKSTNLYKLDQARIALEALILHSTGKSINGKFIAEYQELISKINELQAKEKRTKRNLALVNKYSKTNKIYKLETAVSILDSMIKNNEDSRNIPKHLQKKERLKKDITKLRKKQSH